MLELVLVCPSKKKRLNVNFLFSGQCISRFTNRKVPYCVKFNPDEDKQNLFVAGMSDKKIVQVSVCVRGRKLPTSVLKFQLYKIYIYIHTHKHKATVLALVSKSKDKTLFHTLWFPP